MIPGAPIEPCGIIGIWTSRSRRAPTFTMRAMTVGVVSTPATPCSSTVSPLGSRSWAASSEEITDWFAPVSTTKKKGPWPSM